MAGEVLTIYQVWYLDPDLNGERDMGLFTDEPKAQEWIESNVFADPDEYRIVPRQVQ